MTWDEDAQIRGVHPIVALRDFILDEESALYPRTLVVGYLDDENYPDDFDPEESQIAEDDLDDIVAQLGDRLRSKILEVTRVLRLDLGGTAIWARTWNSDIVSGKVEAAASLLLALLPNLEKLRIVDTWRYDEQPPFHAVLQGLLKAATNPGGNPGGLNLFRRLVEVGLQGGASDFHVVPDFNALPSIRTIKGRYIDGEEEMLGSGFRFGPPAVHFERHSKITTLEFHQSSIDKNSFRDCIGRIKALQRFTYDFCGSTAVGDQTWEPRGIVQVLGWFASTSLVHLELTGVSDIYHVQFRHGEPFIGTLRAFEALETLRLETVMLYREVEGTDDGTPDVDLGSGPREIGEDEWAGGPNALFEPERLVDILPASARRLRLVGGLSDEEAIAMLADIVELKDERVPNLGRIFFEDVDPSSEISSVCESASIRAKFCGRV